MVDGKVKEETPCVEEHCDASNSRTNERKFVEPLVTPNGQYNHTMILAHPEVEEESEETETFKKKWGETSSFAYVIALQRKHG